MEREIKARGLERHFILLGWREDVAELLAASDALLLTSLHEGLPRVVLAGHGSGEAGGCHGGQWHARSGQERRHTGFLHEPHDTEEPWRKVFSRFFPTRDWAGKMGKEGNRKVLRNCTFLISKMLKEIEKLYDELASPKQVK